MSSASDRHPQPFRSIPRLGSGALALSLRLCLRDLRKKITFFSRFFTGFPCFSTDHGRPIGQKDRPICCAQMVHDAVHIRKHMMNGEAGVLADSELQLELKLAGYRNTHSRILATDMLRTRAIGKCARNCGRSKGPCVNCVQFPSMTSSSAFSTMTCQTCENLIHLIFQTCF